MREHSYLLLWLVCAAFAAVPATASRAVVTTPASAEDEAGHCDPLVLPLVVDELGGQAVFPADEAITHAAFGIGIAACSASKDDDPDTVDQVVQIVNQTNRTFPEVWYVADRETTLTNFDGFVQAAAGGGSLPAFKIDALGANTPLLTELNGSIPNVLEPGEEWHFVIQDYASALGLSHDALDSIGLDSQEANPVSSGSIIAVPEPSALAMLGLCGFLLGRRWPVIDRCLAY
jgi:hypothetical protein